MWCDSPYWDNGGIGDAGAVTWGSKTNGVSGVVSVANSLIGSSINDWVGSVLSLEQWQLHGKQP